MNRHILLVFLFISVFLIPPATAITVFDATGRAIGPRGGMIEQLTPDRSRPGIWWAVNDGNLYRSIDDAHTWGLIMDGVSAMALHPKTSEIIVARWNTERRAADILYGRKSATRFTRIGRYSSFVRQLYWDPFDSDVLYIISGESFASSHDRGQTWKTQSQWASYRSKSSLNPSAPESCGSADIYGFMASPIDKGVLYIWGVESQECSGFALKSDDFGKSWFASRFPAGHFHFDPLFPDRAYSVSFSGISELTSAGWKSISTTPMTSIAGVPGDPKHLYGLQSDQNSFSLQESFDGGRSWRAREEGNHSPSQWAVADDPAKSIVLGTFGGGVFKRLAPRLWWPVNQGFEPGSATGITKGEDPETVYTLIGNSFLYRKDGSRSFWNSLFFGLPANEGFDLLVANPGNGNHLFLGSRGYLAVSFNDGVRWKESRGLRYGGVEAVAFDPRSSRLVYALGAYFIYESEDGGLRFRKLPALLESGWYNPLGLYLNPSNSRVAYAISRGGIKKTVDRWQSASSVVTPGQGEIRAGVLIDDDRLLIIKDSGELFRSFNGGSNWERLSEVPGDSQLIRKLLSADSAGKHLYLLSSRSYVDSRQPQLQESTDFGAHWTDAGRRLGSNTTIYDMTDPKLQPVYLATSKGVIK